MTIIAHFSKENISKFISSTKSISSPSGAHLSCRQIKLVKDFKWIYSILNIDGCNIYIKWFSLQSIVDEQIKINYFL
jgi:hypothetical protein